MDLIPSGKQGKFQMHVLESLSTKRELQRNLKPNVTYIFQPIITGGVANSAHGIGVHNWVTLGLSFRCNLYVWYYFLLIRIREIRSWLSFAGQHLQQGILSTHLFLQEFQAHYHKINKK